MRGSTRRVKRRPGRREGYFGLIHQNFSHATRVRFVTYSLVLTTFSSHPCVSWEHSHNQFGNYLLLSIIFTLVRTHAPIREPSHRLLTLYIYQMLSLNSVTCEHAFFLPSRTRISTLKPHTSREKKKIWEAVRRSPISVPLRLLTFKHRNFPNYHDPKKRS